MTPSFGTCRTMICALMVFALAGCQQTGAASCAGFLSNDLSPSGTVALIQADRPGYERVIGNDRAGVRKGCWK